MKHAIQHIYGTVQYNAEHHDTLQHGTVSAPHSTAVLQNEEAIRMTTILQHVTDNDG